MGLPDFYPGIGDAKSHEDYNAEHAKDKQTSSGAPQASGVWVNVVTTVVPPTHHYFVELFGGNIEDDAGVIFRLRVKVGIITTYRGYIGGTPGAYLPFRTPVLCAAGTTIYVDAMQFTGAAKTVKAFWSGYVETV